MLTTRPSAETVVDRLKQFPTSELPISGTLSVRWDDHMIPFIEAEKDEDLPFALGMVHAHLRLAQLEIMRFASQGRVSELIGPFGVDVDRTLRILNFGKATNESIASMPAETKLWASRFVEGLNLYIGRNQDHLPVDLRALGVSKISPWTLEDLLTVWRLASIDVNWGIYFSALSKINQPDFEVVWKKMLELGAQSSPSFTTEDQKLGQLLFGFTKTGSNSIVIGKKKSASGAGIIANDPHLGMMLPSLWLIGGFHSPSYHALGLMIPSLPAIALGRNDAIAWGGTNMWGLSTYLYALTDEEAATAKSRTESISVRTWFNSKVTIRTTKWGPIISDSPYLKKMKRPIAFAWVGHEPSDELTAFLKANRAQNISEFRQAFDTYGVSAQNFLVTDRAGNIGHVLAYKQPLRPDSKNKDLLQPTSNFWTSFRKPTEMPFAYNPPKGYIASANNRPVETDPEIGWFFQSSDRIDRWQELVDKSGPVDIEMLKKWQMDTFSPTGFRVQNELVRRLGSSRSPEINNSALWTEFKKWDGYYRADSRGPVAFETLMASFAPLLLSKKGFDENSIPTFVNSPSWKRLTLKEMSSLPDSEIEALTQSALESATPKFEKYQSWQEMHRLEVAHILARLPLVGSRYRFDEFGYGGGADTILKTSVSLSGEKATSGYGTDARHISDLSNPDENYFVIFGGQDGWLTSPQTSDQIALWREGKYIRLPLSKKNLPTVFTHELVLKPD